MYETVPALNHRDSVASDDQDNIHYASVVFKNFYIPEESLSPRLSPDTTEEEDVQYATVNINRYTAAIQ